MTVTFAQARDVVAARLAAGNAPPYEFLVGGVVESWGAEDGRSWMVSVDYGYVVMDAPIYLVDKATGALTVATFLDDSDRFAAMTPVGNVPDDDTLAGPVA